MRQGTADRTSRPFATIAGAMLLVALGFGCLPLPYHKRQSPDIRGVVRRNGIAAAGVTVSLERKAPLGDRACAHPTLQTITDRYGRFHFYTTGTWTWPMAYLGDPPLSRAFVCFAFPDGTKAHLHETRWGYSYQVLSCDIDADASPEDVALTLERAYLLFHYPTTRLPNTNRCILRSHGGTPDLPLPKQDLF